MERRNHSPLDIKPGYEAQILISVNSARKLDFRTDFSTARFAAVTVGKLLDPHLRERFYSNNSVEEYWADLKIYR